MVFQASVQQRQIAQPSAAPALQAISSLTSQQLAQQTARNKARASGIFDLLGLGVQQAGEGLREKFARDVTLEEQLRKEQLKQKQLKQNVEAARAAGFSVPQVPGSADFLSTLTAEGAPTKRLQNIEKLGGLLGPSQFAGLTGAAQEVSGQLFPQTQALPGSSLRAPLRAERIAPTDGTLFGGISQEVRPEPEIGLGFQKLISEQAKREREERVGTATEQAKIDKALDEARLSRANAQEKVNQLDQASKQKIFTQGKPNSKKVFDHTGLVAFDDVDSSPDILSSRRAFTDFGTKQQKSKRIQESQEGAGFLTDLMRVVERAEKLVEANPNAVIRDLKGRVEKFSNDPVGTELAALDSQLGTFAVRLAVIAQGSRPSDVDVKFLREAMPDVFQSPRRFKATKKLFAERLLSNAMREALTVGTAPQFNALNVFHKKIVRNGQGKFQPFGVAAGEAETEAASAPGLLGIDFVGLEQGRFE